MTAADKPFATEAALCAAFIEALPKGWTAYPETGDWDILLVRAEDGFQIGVEAKLRLNAKVIAQALDDNSWQIDNPGPDCRAVLVPEGTGGHFRPICDYIGLTVIRVYSDTRYRIRSFGPDLPTMEAGRSWYDRNWHELCPMKRVVLPEYVPDVPAGASAPVRLTDWKIKAIRIAVILEQRGHVTRADFKALGIDIRRWLPREGRWLQPGEHGFTAGPNLPDFKAQHPSVYEQISADAADWMPKVETAGALL